jgi:hypothetical protein
MPTMKRSRIWLTLTPIALALAVVIFCLLPIQLDANPSQTFPRELAEHPANQSIGEQDHRNYIKQNADDAGSIVNHVGGIHTEQDGDAGSDPETYEQKTDWMVILTGLLVFVAFLQACTFLVQYSAMKYSARAQIVLVPAQPNLIPSLLVAIAPSAQSPLKVEPQPIQIPGPITDFVVGKNPKFNVNVLNVGETPAYALTYECWMEIIPPPFNDFPSNVHVAVDSNKRTIYPKSPPFTISINTDVPLSQLDFDELNRGQRELWVRVRVKYRDLFRKRRYRWRRSADFGWKYTNVGINVISKYQTRINTKQTRASGHMRFDCWRSGLSRIHSLDAWSA